MQLVKLFSRKYYLILVWLIFSIQSVNADAIRNRPLNSYFIDNIIFQTLYSGGYYTVIILIIISILCYFSRSIREIVLSVAMAIFAIFLLVFFYEALEDFEFIPPAN